jgi:hypothetical protein
MSSAVLRGIVTVYVPELDAEIREGKSHRLGNGRNGELGPLFHETLGFLQADTVDIAGEPTPVRIRIKDCVQMLTPKTEAPHDILALESGVGIETLFTNGLIDKTEQVSV